MLTLLRHSGSSGGEGFKVEAALARPAPGRLALTFVVSGPLHELILPEADEPRRTDELWRHTCLEAFVAPAEGASYYEFNFAPSTRWAAYRLDSYRAGMAAPPIDTPRILARRFAERLELEVGMSIHTEPALASSHSWRVGVAAVLEDTAGRISYWALAHPPGKPDFHHPDGFALDLPVTDSQ